MPFLSKIQLIRRKRTQQWCVNVPAELARALDLKKGEVVEFRIVDKGTIVLTRPNVPPDFVELPGSLGQPADLPEMGSATDPKEVAEEVFSALSTQEVEDAWDQAGSS
jgi:bifunctional DNA-binding transcriptional regulator/antitoxin component of YhaV-PrlF toxin-antitoxin module